MSRIAADVFLLWFENFSPWAVVKIEWLQNRPCKGVKLFLKHNKTKLCKIDKEIVLSYANLTVKTGTEDFSIFKKRQAG